MAEIKPMTIYLDTSVLGGYFDEAFLDETRSMFRLIREGRIVPVVSEIVLGELAQAPQSVYSILDELLEMGTESLEIDEEAIRLQEAYLSAGVVSHRWADDAMHVALATMGRVDAIVSWNFKHLVNPRKSRAFNAINLTMGYGLVEIRSPGEIVRSVESD